MKTPLLIKKNHFSKATPLGYLKLVAFALLLCLSYKLYAVVKPALKYPGYHKTRVKTIKSSAFAAPVISYSSPHSYIIGTAIATLSPQSSGVDPLGYSSGLVSAATGFGA